MSYNVNSKGYYGDFGGAYIPWAFDFLANYLKENGYKEIAVIEGGITSWVKNGNDLVYDFSEEIKSIEE